MCDSCDGEYHLYCLDPPLSKAPPGNGQAVSSQYHREQGKPGVMMMFTPHEEANLDLLGSVVTGGSGGLRGGGGQDTNHLHGFGMLVEWHGCSHQT